MFRRAAVSLVVLALVMTACSRRQEPQDPSPQPTANTPQAATPATDDADAAAAAAAARAAELARIRGVIEEMVFFDYDRSDIRSDQQETLTRKASVLRSNPEVALRVSGHADERGSVEYNLALGMRRAESVRQFLTGFGIDASRLSTETLGEDRPLDPGATEDAYARNRRAEFTITRGGENLVPSGQ